MPSPLVAVGALNVDLVFRLAGPVRMHASNVATLERRIGGVAANVARAYAAECGAECGAVAASGRDGSNTDGRAQDGAILVCATGDGPAPRCEGVELLTVVRPDVADATYAAVLDADGELRLGLAATDVAETLTADEVLDRLGERRAGAWLVDANLSTACLADLAGLADLADRAAPFAAMAVSPEKALRLAPLASRVDCLFCNRREAVALTSAAADAPLGALADALRARGWRHVVLTDGPGPLAAVTPGGTTVLDVPAAPAHGAGVNGAGDALAGATLVHWLAGASLADALRHAGLPAAARHLARPPNRPRLPSP